MSTECRMVYLEYFMGYTHIYIYVQIYSGYFQYPFLDILPVLPPSQR